MTRKLLSISTLTFIHSETIVAIVGSIGQGLSDNFTMFPYLTRPTLLAKFKNLQTSEIYHDLRIILSNFIKAISQNGEENNGHE